MASPAFQKQQGHNDFDEQRMVDDIFGDVIHIAEMEAQNLTTEQQQQQQQQSNG